MTLKEKYTIKNKKRMPQFIFLYSILVIFFAIYTSLAKYEKISEGYIKIAVADWKIALNGKELTSLDNNILKDSITLVTGNNADENSIESGQTRYFDIEIDPTGTEVSFWYQVTLELPDGFHVSSYSLNDEGTFVLPENNTLEGTILLNNKNEFENSDAQKIRYYCYSDEDTAIYTIAANVEVKQVL